MPVWGPCLGVHALGGSYCTCCSICRSPGMQGPSPGLAFWRASRGWRGLSAFRGGIRHGRVAPRSCGACPRLCRAWRGLPGAEASLSCIRQRGRRPAHPRDRRGTRLDPRRDEPGGFRASKKSADRIRCSRMGLCSPRSGGGSALGRLRARRGVVLDGDVGLGRALDSVNGSLFARNLARTDRTARFDDLIRSMQVLALFALRSGRICLHFGHHTGNASTHWKNSAFTVQAEYLDHPPLLHKKTQWAISGRTQ